MFYALVMSAVVLALCYVIWRWMSTSSSDEDLPGMIGLEGDALETFSEAGRVFVRGEEWKASTTHGIIESGSAVRVVGYQRGMVLVVESLRKE